MWRPAVKILIDTSERAATPSHDCGVFEIEVPEERVNEYVEALVMLGFTPMADEGVQSSDDVV